ncbi:hypothetical protein K1W54_36160 [Micromonospora sp. CPCC 205371]|nr:hypothetical protein [Micromonospora sp. CPCC 205371]
MQAKRLFLVGSLAATIIAAGCGAPEYEYVKNSEEQTYFKVPSSWRKVDQNALNVWAADADPDSQLGKLRQQLMWNVAYDASGSPSATHVYGLLPTPDPVAWAKVERLAPVQSNRISFDALRNMVLPVTDDLREAATQAGSMLSGFELLHDEVLTPSEGLHGVRVAYNYDLLGIVHTFDLTALVNNDATRLYLLFVRCSARCYTERADELNTVVTSFTVRS